MQPRFEPREVRLRDGRTATLRAVSRGDEQEVLQAFGHLGAESRYLRFMGTVRELDPKRIQDVIASFPERGFAVAATVPAPDGIDIVGAASFVVEDARSCEFAMTVLESWSGAGLGRILLAELVQVARGRGLAAMRGFVLAHNRPMLNLAQRLGFRVERSPEDFNVRLVTLAL